MYVNFILIKLGEKENTSAQSNILILLVLGVVWIEVLWKTFPVIGMRSPPAAHSNFVLFYRICEWDSWGIILFCFMGYKCPLSFILSLPSKHSTEPTVDEQSLFSLWIRKE